MLYSVEVAATGVDGSSRDDDLAAGVATDGEIWRAEITAPVVTYLVLAAGVEAEPAVLPIELQAAGAHAIAATLAGTARIATAGGGFQAEPAGSGAADLGIAAGDAAATAVGTIRLYIDTRGIATGLAGRADDAAGATVGIFTVKRFAPAVPVAVVVTALAAAFAVLAAFAPGAIAAIIAFVTFLADLLAAGLCFLSSAFGGQGCKGAAEESPHGASARGGERSRQRVKA